MALLDMKDVRGGYGDADILHGVSMTVAEREIVVIVGPNGAGKSTAMKSVFGLLHRRGHHRLGARPHRAARHLLRAAGGQRVPRDDGA